MRGFVVALALVLPFPALAGTAADIARAIRENSFDRDECYRVRDITIVKDDLRIYLTDGHLIFSRPVAGRRMAAVFTADVDGGDAEVLLRPPDLAERRSLVSFIDSPTLDEHFQTAVFFFTGDDYQAIRAQFANNPANKKTSELAALLDEQWTPVLRNIGESYQTRIALDLMGGPARQSGLFAGMIESRKLGNFDVIFDPYNAEQIMAGQLTSREGRAFFNTWTSFRSRATRKSSAPPRHDLITSDYRIEATVSPDLSLSAVTRVKVKPVLDGMVAAAFEISPQMSVTSASIDGRAAEVLQRDSIRGNAARAGNGMFLVIPQEPLRAGREYEFEFHHAGNVVRDAGAHVYYVTARGNWYPIHRIQFATYDLTLRYPQDLDLVTPGEVVSDRTEGEWRVTRRRTTAAIRLAAFNLGAYEHARVERGPYQVDVCANRSVEQNLQPRQPQILTPAPGLPGARRHDAGLSELSSDPPPNPLERLRSLASGVASAMEFMAAKFGPPALPHLTVSPIPGTFGQGFPGLIYLSTLAYFRTVPGTHGPASESQELFFQDLLQAHETAHQWWGNRVASSGYRDNWLMEGLANYSAMLYLEKTKGPHSLEVLLDGYRNALLEKNSAGQTVDSTGPIVLGTRLENSQQPSAWRIITYDKGTWIIQMLRRRLGEERFLALLAEMLKRYDHREITTEQFRELAAEFVPPKSEDPKLEAFFEQWVYGTGIPTLKMTYTVKGKLPVFKVVGTIAQTEVDENFSVRVPVEIQLGRGRNVTQWVRTATGEPVTFTVSLKQAPTKVVLDPNRAVLHR